jgi:hypothetical protein
MPLPAHCPKGKVVLVLVLENVGRTENENEDEEESSNRFFKHLGGRIRAKVPRKTADSTARMM